MEKIEKKEHRTRAPILSSVKEEENVLDVSHTGTPGIYIVNSYPFLVKEHESQIVVIGVKDGLKTRLLTLAERLKASKMGLIILDQPSFALVKSDPRIIDPYPKIGLIDSDTKLGADYFFVRIKSGDTFQFPREHFTTLFPDSLITRALQMESGIETSTITIEDPSVTMDAMSFLGHVIGRKDKIGGPLPLPLITLIPKANLESAGRYLGIMLLELVSSPQFRTLIDADEMMKWIQGRSVIPKIKMISDGCGYLNWLDLSNVTTDLYEALLSYAVQTDCLVLIDVVLTSISPDKYPFVDTRLLCYAIVKAKPELIARFLRRNIDFTMNIDPTSINILNSDLSLITRTLKLQFRPFYLAILMGNKDLVRSMLNDPRFPRFALMLAFRVSIELTTQLHHNDLLTEIMDRWNLMEVKEKLKLPSLQSTHKKHNNWNGTKFVEVALQAENQVALGLFFNEPKFYFEEVDDIVRLAMEKQHEAMFQLVWERCSPVFTKGFADTQIHDVVVSGQLSILKLILDSDHGPSMYPEILNAAITAHRYQVLDQMLGYKFTLDSKTVQNLLGKVYDNTIITARLLRDPRFQNI